jgi:hypothetical protein
MRVSGFSQTGDGGRSSASCDTRPTRSSKGTVTGDDQLRDREQLAVQLQHTHLPKLADHGVVEYERRSGAVRYRPSEPVERVLDTLPGEVSIPDP